MYQISKLANGLTVATAEMPHMASVSVGIWVGVGGRYEPAELSGASHFIEHLLFKGTKRRNALEISQAVEGMGGYLNAFTSEENTCFYSKARHDRLGEILEVLMDMFLRSRFDPVEIEKERAVIKDEVAMYRDQPHHYVHELLDALIWPDQALGRAVTGTPETLDGIRREELVAFYGANYTPESTVVVAAGKLKHRQVVREVTRYARYFRSGKRPVFAPAEARQVSPRVCLHKKEVEQTQVALGVRTCSRHDERRYSLRLLNTILGENMSSRLFQTVREEHGLAYSIYSALSFFDDAGILNIAAGVETEQLVGAMKLIMKEMRSILEQAPSTAEVRRARDYAIGQMELGLENSENHMMWVGEQFLGYGRVVAAEQVKRELSAVKPSDIKAVATEFFRADRLNLSVISPRNGAKEMQDILRL